MQDVQGTLDVGREKLDDTLSRGELVKNETSKQGQDLIREELAMLTNDFEQFDTDINELQNNLGKLDIMEKIALWKTLIKIVWRGLWLCERTMQSLSSKGLTNQNQNCLLVTRQNNNHSLGNSHHKCFRSIGFDNGADTPEPLYKTVCYNTVLDIAQSYDMKAVTKRNKA